MKLTATEYEFNKKHILSWYVHIPSRSKHSRGKYVTHFEFAYIDGDGCKEDGRVNLGDQWESLYFGMFCYDEKNL